MLNNNIGLYGGMLMADNPDEIIKVSSEEEELCPCGSGLSYERCCGS
jgi:uncharacterized protein YecA (UPF0149 family)